MTGRKLATTFGAIAFCLMMTGAGVMGGFLASRRPPLVLYDVHEADGVALRGGWMDLDISLTRHRLCDAHVERWLWQDVNGVRRWVPLLPVANPPTPIGVETTYRLSLPVPVNIPSGQWHYFSRTRDECASPLSLARETVRDSGDVPVLILDPPDQAAAEIVAPSDPVIMRHLPTAR